MIVVSPDTAAILHRIASHRRGRVCRRGRSASSSVGSPWSRWWAVGRARPHSCEDALHRGRRAGSPGRRIRAAAGRSTISDLRSSAIRGHRCPTTPRTTRRTSCRRSGPRSRPRSRCSPSRPATTCSRRRRAREVAATAFSSSTSVRARATPVSCIPPTVITSATRNTASNCGPDNPDGEPPNLPRVPRSHARADRRDEAVLRRALRGDRSELEREVRVRGSECVERRTGELARR